VKNHRIGIDELIKIAQEEIDGLDAKRKRILKQIETLKSLKIEKEGINQTKPSFIPSTYKPAITNLSSEEDKISLFRLLFRGREDVFPKRFESYDRFFPSQDTMPQGGFGNLIALPLQKPQKIL